MGLRHIGLRLRLRCLGRLGRLPHAPLLWSLVGLRRSRRRLRRRELLGLRALLAAALLAAALLDSALLAAALLAVALRVIGRRPRRLERGAAVRERRRPGSQRAGVVSHASSLRRLLRRRAAVRRGGLSRCRV